MFSATVRSGIGISSWWIIAMPLRMASCGLRSTMGLPPQENLARVRRVQAGEHFHQRGFARAVFAHQRVDLARLKRQRNVDQRLDAGERFADTSRLEDRNRGGGSMLLHEVE